MYLSVITIVRQNTGALCFDIRKLGVVACYFHFQGYIEGCKSSVKRCETM